MIVAVCVESTQNGLLLCGRRLSRDRAQRDDLLTLCQNGRLWTDAFSAPLFAGSAAQVLVSPDFLNLAGQGELCFVEDRPLRPCLSRMEALVLYRWNRAYPSDVQLDIDMDAFVLTERREFAGTSHERITREIYRRGESHGENT